MADIYSPWMAGPEEDVTDMGMVTPEYMEMQQGESEDSATPDAMQMALQTINQQSQVIATLMSQLKGN
jgi:hypothetical protein